MRCTALARRCSLSLALAALALACDDGSGGGSSGGAGGATPDASRDAAPRADGSTDGARTGDSAADATRDATRDATADAARPDEGPPDYGPELDAAPLPPCPDSQPLPPPPPAGRWLLSMFHFNVQYVAGGLDGFAAAAFGNPELAERTDRSEREVEDQIIRESFAPLLGILERHPDLALTLELQGYMIDLIRARHPRTLARMQALSRTNQLELASIHWSDQFFLAFGRADMDESWRRTQASFAAADLPVSRAVFTQEGQFGEGFAEWLAERRPEAVMVMPRNLAGFYRADLVEQPLFKVGALDVVLPRGLNDATVQRDWTFFDDGELLATNGQNPYFPATFVHSTAAVRDYEHRLRCAADAGWRVGRVSDYVDAVRAAGHAPPPLGPFVDGTWQPGSTRGPLRWMGGGGLYKRHERDNEVLTTCVRARAAVLALVAANPADAGLDEAWKHLLWGQVSDARGINPWLGEVEYGLRHCGRALALGEGGLRAAAATRGAAGLRVDTGTGAVTPVDAVTSPLPRVPVEPPVEVRVEEDGGRPYTLSWTIADAPAGPDNPPRLEIAWGPHPALAERHAGCLAAGRPAYECAVAQPIVSISAPRTPGAMIYRPALGTALRRHVEADFALSGDAASDGIWYPAADGLIGLGENRFLIKDIRSIHLAWGLPPDRDNGRVVLRDETLPPQNPAVWHFWYAADEATALRLADRNLHPVVEVAR